MPSDSETRREVPDMPSTQSGYVLCPETVTSPAPSPGAEAIGLRPNIVCGERCAVHREIEEGVMQFACPRGHYFFVEAKDVRHD